VGIVVPNPIVSGSAGTPTDESLVRLSMREAALAATDGNPPFGAVLLDADGRILATAHNTQVSSNDPTAHAEINVLRAGGAIRRSATLEGCVVAVNAEPCSMCLSALIKSGIARLVYGAPHEPHLDPYLPAADVLARARCPPAVTGGVLGDECADQIRAYREGTPPVD
jgi:tRNA(adenine34) deaminase